MSSNRSNIKKDDDDDDSPPDYVPPPPTSPPPPPSASPLLERKDSAGSFQTIDLDEDLPEQQSNTEDHNNTTTTANNDNNNNNNNSNNEEIFNKKHGSIDLNRNLSHDETTTTTTTTPGVGSKTMVEQEQDENKPDEKPEPVSFFKLFKYATTLDKVYIALGSLFAISLGLAFPLIVLLMGRITDTFVEFQIFRSLDDAPDKEERTWYYDNILSKTNTTLEYFEAIKNYYKRNDTSPIDDIRTRCDLSIEELVTIFNNSIFQNGTLYVDTFKTETAHFAGYMGLVAIGFAVLDFFALGLWAQAARNQTFKIKKLFYRAIIHQDIAWFDSRSSGDFATQITNDLNLVREGMGDKIALTIMSFSTLVFAIVMAFYNGWELTLVSMAIMPVLGMAFIILGKIQVKFAASDSEAYGKAGAIAEEVINLIRTVYAFGGQQKEIERYRENIEPVKRNGIRRSLITAISLGLMYFAIYASYGLSFWYGVKLIIRSIENHETPPRYQASTMLVVFFNVLMGTFSLGQTAPYFESITKACGAARTVFQIMERKPEIDSLSQEGKRMVLKGKVQFRNVVFSYPTRKEVPILNGLNLDAEPGQTVALVGSSGCGKSTIIQLIQRFYDPDSGVVLIDEHDIKELNVGNLRDQIGVVGQEPVLFGYSIMENIAMGNPEATKEDVQNAAREANAFDFIQNLPDKFDTMVGERGAQLSGGQKQRIAIARALVRRPKILLLDESTSALDSESESIVQIALDKASRGRTTFVVAHRLSTIRNADKIILIDQGRIKESGTHQELMEAKGIYYNMAQLQYQDTGDYTTTTINESNQTNEEMQEDNRQRIESRMEHGRSKSIRSMISMLSSISYPKEDDRSDQNDGLPIQRLLNYVKPDRLYLIIATCFAFINGLTIPIYSFVFGEVLGVLQNLDLDYIRGEILKYSLIFLTMGILAGVFQFLQVYLYGISSENLTYRLRNDLFKTILKQEIAFFDDEQNSTGALCARLSNDASAVQGATGSRLSVIAQTVSILLAGIIMSMVYCWKLSLVMICFIPLIIVSIYYQMKILMGMSISSRKSTEKATKIAVESISNIRTVASLHAELKFISNYVSALELDFRKTRFEPYVKSAAFGSTQLVFNSAYAIALFYGSRLIIWGQLEYSQLFKCTEAVLFGTNMIGQSVAFSPDYQKGKIAAVSIFKLLDRVPKIISGTITELTGCRGDVSFKEVQFRYPTRPQVKVLRKITFSVNQGQTVALVGSSGCGKSTCTQILERFYDIKHGSVEVDDVNIEKLNVDWLRAQIGIVSQEPMLFDKSIRDNIAYGDNTRQVEMIDIVRASEKANIHKFIKSLPKGYETSVGDKGAQLSGGQKQRIAIARALIRNPKILLLDEATSALDSESEKIVQEALDEARHGRTCLMIAHRLSTIRDVDMIFVIEKGRVVENGTHDQLLEQRGLYYQMYMTQCGQR